MVEFRNQFIYVLIHYTQTYNIHIVVSCVLIFRIIHTISHTIIHIITIINHHTTNLLVSPTGYTPPSTPITTIHTNHNYHHINHHHSHQSQ